MTSNKRGAFILFEGLDKCGKTTQANLLVKRLDANPNTPSTLMRFPDRGTTIGRLISEYLEKKTEMDGRLIHLLFSANRWEKAREIRRLLDSGITIVMDRYSYSGVAYSAAKGLDVNWCFGTERGLPKPDLIFLLNVSKEVARSRGCFDGEERYEKEDVQDCVRQHFEWIVEEPLWKVIDGNQPLEAVHEQVFDIASREVQQVKSSEDLPVRMIGSF